MYQKSSDVAVQIRTFSWGEFDALVEVIGAIFQDQPSDHPVDRVLFRKWLEQPGFQPERDLLIAEVEGRIAGYALLTPEVPIGRTVVAGGVHPQLRRRGLGQQLLHAVVAHARALHLSRVHVCVPPGNAGTSVFLLNEGFTPVRVHWYMRWRDGPLEVPVLPEGYALRSFTFGEEALLTEIQNTAFEDTWGFCPNTVEQIAYRVCLPGTRPEGIIFLTHREQVVGYNWTRIDGPSHQATGIICMTGVAPSYRSRGLGRAVVVAGMQYLKAQGVQRIELTVDRDNLPACRLYQALGFQRYAESHWYEFLL